MVSFHPIYFMCQVDRYIVVKEGGDSLRIERCRAERARIILIRKPVAKKKNHWEKYIRGRNVERTER